MIKRILIALAVLGLVFGGVIAWKMYMGYMTQQFMAKRKPPAASVAAQPAATSRWQSTLQAVASLEAVQGVQVSGEIAGQVEAIHFSSGQEVKQNDLLIELDTTVDRAELERLRTVLDLAKVQFDRQKRLVNREMSPQSELDEAKARYRQAQAEVKKQRIFIGKKRIQAPFAGKLGIRKVDLGQYLSPGEPIVGLQSLHPIYANFSLPQQAMDRVSQGQKVQFTLEGWPETTFSGQITAVEAKVNENTRNVSLQATLDNEDGRLRPGMYGQATIILPQERSLITLPQTAVKYNPYGDIVFVLTAKQDGGEDGGKTYTASRRFVTLGERRGDQVAVLKGLEAGELVVVSGQHKLREGATATVNNEILPSNEPAPQVKDT
jgi:membrane fusion protein (multidrug efflux system)